MAEDCALLNSAGGNCHCLFHRPILQRILQKARGKRRRLKKETLGRTDSDPAAVAAASRAPEASDLAPLCQTLPRHGSRLTLASSGLAAAFPLPQLLDSRPNLRAMMQLAEKDP